MKFLFHDGSGKIAEASSKDELDRLISNTPDKNRIKIWIFHTSDWITYSEYLKTQPAAAVKTVPVFQPAPPPLPLPAPEPEKKEIVKAPKRVTKPLQILLNILIVGVVAAGITAAWYYTRKEWGEPEEIQITAPRPANAPAMDVDSLIIEMEIFELRTLDKLTKSNLRARNNWPEKIVLTLQGDRRKHLNKDSIFLFNNLHWIVANLSGHVLDNVVAELDVWRNNEITEKDTFHLSNIDFKLPFKNAVNKKYKGDSVSVRIHSIRSLDLNFCYSYEKESVSGNPKDKWFCKD